MRIWEEFLIQLEAELGTETVHKWLRSLRVIRFDAANLYLEACDAFQISWFDEYAKERAQKLLKTPRGRPLKIHLTLSDKTETTPNTPTSTAYASKKKPAEKETSYAAPPPFVLHFEQVEPEFTLDTFLATPSSLPAFKLIQTVSDLSKSVEWANFNPIYIYGPNGSGKTHLLQGTVAALRSQGSNVVYVQSETFAHHVVTAIQAGAMEKLRNHYRLADVLVIDDVHLFARKSTTQEELFHTFNTLHTAGKQILLSANVLPSQLKQIEPRLISRFEWGIVLPLEQPSLEQKKAILTLKAERQGFPLNQPVVDFIVANFQSTKSISAALMALMLRFRFRDGAVLANRSSTQLTVTTVEHLLQDLLKREEQIALTPQKVIQKVANHFGILPEDILKPGKSREYSIPRHIAIYLCRTELKIPFTKIRDLFSRDHSTAMSSVKLVQAAVDVHDEEYTGAINDIKQSF